MKINLALVDDDQVLANILKRELNGFPELGDIRLYSSGHQFVNELSLDAPIPHVVLMDISMGIADEGIQTTRLLHERFPDIKVIMFTIAEDDDFIFEAFKAGAVGYLLKNEKLSFILKAIVDVWEGGALMSPGIALKTIRFLAPIETKTTQPNNSFELSERELEVLRLVSKGHIYSAIGNRLFISAETVKKHMTNIFRKLQVKNKIEALNKAKELL